MRVLFAYPAPEMAVWDVAQGLHRGLLARGHDIRVFAYNKRLAYHGKAMGAAPDPDTDPIGWDRYRRNVMKQASETIALEALYHAADVVVLVCGLNFHPIGGWLLRQIGVPVAVVLTESPYEDDAQRTFVNEMQAAAVFTHERVSAQRDGWTYLPHAYDPGIHQPVPPDLDQASDVLLIGTGWPERRQLLEAVDWAGIRLKIVGVWPDLTETSPLWPFYTPAFVENTYVPRLYAAATICLNQHRYHVDAESLNPRAYELAACGAFHLSDPRAEVIERFGDSVPTFESAAQLEALIRHYLTDDDGRRRCAEQARSRVLGETFDARAAVMEPVLHAVAARHAVALPVTA